MGVYNRPDEPHGRIPLFFPQWKHYQFEHPSDKCLYFQYTSEIRATQVCKGPLELILNSPTNLAGINKDS